jgi:hypothetical protein
MMAGSQAPWHAPSLKKVHHIMIIQSWSKHCFQGVITPVFAKANLQPEFMKW